MKLLWTDQAWEDYQHWLKTDKATLTRLNTLIENTRRTPFEGLGKPEPLKGTFSGWWSRRITGEHRLVYRVVGDGSAQHLEIAQCRYHY